MNELIKETKATLLDYLPNIIVACETASEHFRDGKETEALQLCEQITTAISWVVEAITGIQKNGISLSIEVSGIDPVLMEMIESLEHQDYVVAADLLSYEFLPMMSEWQQSIEQMDSYH